MRPERFAKLVIEAAKTLPPVQDAVALSSIGHTEHPYGVALRFQDGRQVWWQITVDSAPGDRFADPEPEPAYGPVPAPLPPADVSGSAIKTEALESALVTACLAADARDTDDGGTVGEIAGVTLFSDSAPRGAIRFGATFRCHDGSRVFLNGLGYLRSGDSKPRGGYFELPEML